jgi:hypothetical protein
MGGVRKSRPVVVLNSGLVGQGINKSPDLEVVFGVRRLYQKRAKKKVS